ncbi:MAG: hypothetical protein RMK29_11275 [Myxococcales bacterium]|nr:hypothetical protein [Myxococcota bacterium]MDW8282288.1 hypothetical protein [Myxococcales bacterium]
MVRRLVLLALAAAVLLYYVLVPGVFGSKAQGDGWFAFHHLPALVLHQSLDMTPVARRDRRYFEQDRHGRQVNRNPVGTSLAMLPVYTLTLVAEAIVRRVRPETPGLEGPPFDLNELQFFWTGLVTAASGVLGLLVLFRLLRRHVGEGPALAGTTAALLCTPLGWYLTVQPHYPHGLTFAAVTLLLERWDATRGQLQARRFLVLGLLGGLAMLVRPQEVVFLLLPLCEVAAGLVRSWRDRAALWLWLRGALLLGLGALLAFSPQMGVWTYHFGLLGRPTTIEPMRPREVALGEVLFSMRCGLLPWTPVVYLALPGLCLGLLARGSVARRALVGPVLVVGAADVYLVAASWMWYGAFGFGCRRLSDLSPFVGLGVALLVERVGQSRWRRTALAALGSVLVLLAALNLTLVELQRRRVLPSSGHRAWPAWRWAERAGAPGWLVSLLRRGYPFVQPAGLLFALRHRAPLTAWEGIVGNYALEREPHDHSVSGAVWDFKAAEAQDFVLEGLLPADGETTRRGRPVRRHVRLLLQPFAREPIHGVLHGELPPGGLRLRWDGHALSWTRVGARVHFTVPEALVRAHRVSSLTLDLPAGEARLDHLRLVSYTRWWER